MTDLAHRMWLLHDMEETAAREAAVWEALAVHVGGTVVAWHLGAASARLGLIRAAIVEQMACTQLARMAAMLDGPMAVLGKAFRDAGTAGRAAVSGLFAAAPAGRLDVRAGERPAASRETPW
ncbi:hypothetical protein ABZ671_18965 [Micromonospora sp. NPDC006766]|uniref:hypothetical protein n=1 Tax=Micromonospora sp. NPDC006766 TaxID=3154778 RepID=UPI0033FED649